MNMTQHQMRYRFPKPPAKVAIVPKVTPKPASPDVLAKARKHLEQAVDYLLIEMESISALHGDDFRAATKQANAAHFIGMALGYLPEPTLATKFRNSYGGKRRIG